MNTMIHRRENHPEPILSPAPVTVQNLQRHFREVYGFNISQTEVMLQSSAKSLEQAFGDAAAALEQANARQLLAPVFHGLKGLFLNMGEKVWAAFARDVEEKLKGDVPVDLKGIITVLRVGLTEVLDYYRDKGKENT